MLINKTSGWFTTHQGAVSRHETQNKLFQMSSSVFHQQTSAWGRSPLSRLFIHDQRDVPLNQGEGEEADVGGVFTCGSAFL